MNSYNTFTFIIILVTNLCFFRYLVYGTELIRITNLYLLRSYTYGRFILIPISRRTHNYACIKRILIQVSPKDIHIRLILMILYLYYGTYTYITNLILVLRSLFLYFGYGSTRRYYRTFYLYKSTCRYYRTDTEVPVGTFRSLPYSFLYSYYLFRVLSYNCLIA